MRIEDLDTARIVPGSETQILRTLEHFGLEWDGPVVRQSARLEHYRAALERLAARGLTYSCSCSRRELESEGAGAYPGWCRTGPRRSGVPMALRLRLPGSSLEVRDRIQGPCQWRLEALGDPILRRRDGLIAYQLAVVVDDAAQGVTDVVRGADLLDSTPWQVAVQQALSLAEPTYAHVPMVVEGDRTKLSKSRRSVGVDPGHCATELVRTLRLMRQEPPETLGGASPREILDWAQRHWRPAAMAGMRAVEITPAGQP